MNYCKISVLIVTYKQANVIGRNIESILRQKEYGLHKIIICDDCSPDNNWAVIQGYVEKFPNIIKAYRNEPNLGIYGNSDKVASLHGDADLFCWLEGDDALEDGVLKGVQEYIAAHNVDLNQAVGIFCDYSTIDPNGKKMHVPNKLIVSSANPLSLYMRNMVSWRASFFTQKVINQFKPTILDQGLALAELLFDSQWFRYLEKTYYFPIPGSIYYSGIGISTQINDMNSEYNTKEAILKWQYMLDHFADNNKDREWLKAKIMRIQCVLTPKVSILVKAVRSYSKGIMPEQLSTRHFYSFIAPMIKALINKK